MSGQGVKRKREDDDGGEDDYNRRPTAADIQRYIDEAPEVEALDLDGVKKLLLDLEKRITKNQELRVKFPDTPAKFIDSEAALDEAISNIATIASAPEYYPHLIKLGSIPSLLGLLTHENTDITVSAIDVLFDLTDADTVLESPEPEAFLQVIVDNQGLELLVQNLARLQETTSEDERGVYKTLGVFENITDLKPSLCDVILTSTELLPWLIKRLQVPSFEANKLYASEILSVLVSHSDIGKASIGSQDNLEIILRTLAGYRKNNPAGQEEAELMENLFDVLCASLLLPQSVTTFVASEGIELMLIMVRSKNKARRGAFKALSYALGKSPVAALTFVRVLGLKSLFPAFMKRGSRKQARRDLETERDEEERVVAILYSLLTLLPADSTELARVVNKFREKEFEKVDRLLELVSEYAQLVARVEAAQAIARSKLPDDEAPDPDEQYLELLDGGLDTLQRVIGILAAVYACAEEQLAQGQKGIRVHIEEMVYQQSLSFASAKQVLQDQLDQVGAGDDALKLRAQLEYLRDALPGDQEETA